MSSFERLDKVKQTIIDIVEEAGDITFCAGWIARRLNEVRRDNGETPVRLFVVQAVLKSMIDDGSIESVGVDSYILSDPENPDEFDEDDGEDKDTAPVINVNVTFNITVHNTFSNVTENNNSDNRIYKGKTKK